MLEEIIISRPELFTARKDIISAVSTYGTAIKIICIQRTLKVTFMIVDKTSETNTQNHYFQIKSSLFWPSNLKTKITFYKF